MTEEKRGPGRPAYLNFEGEKRVTIRLPEADVEVIEKLAGHLREGVSGWIRDVVSKAVAKERSKKR